MLALLALGLSACGSSSGTTGTTAPTGRSTASTAPPAAGSGSTGLCRALDTFSAQETGLTSASRVGGSGTDQLAALRAYARGTKVAFDQVAPRITAGLAAAPTVVQDAWASLHRQVDQLFVAGAAAPSVSDFAQNAAALQASDAYVGPSQTVAAYAHGVCRTASPT